MSDDFWILSYKKCVSPIVLIARHCRFFPPALLATVLPDLGIWDFQVEREVRFIQPAEETFKTQLLANVSFTRSLP